MQVAHDFEVINMLDGDALDKIVKQTNLILLFLK
jgi:formate-dependent phosphoribosylglycinamide formyltransferase (GAR transformylase)